MARYPLNLPQELKLEAETWATRQGVSFNQFVMWAVAEKVGALRQDLGDPAFPHVTYRRGASGWPTAVVRGTGIRVQTLAVAAERWGLSTVEIGAAYDLPEMVVREALDFYAAHRTTMDTAIAAEEAVEEAMGARHG
jgi:uncharacterized protein (DUF433 family)